MLIRFRRGKHYMGKTFSKGDVVEVVARWALQWIADRVADLVIPDEPPVVPEPEVVTNRAMVPESRDPVSQPAKRKRGR
jgi:hypothetical protein